MKDERIIWEAQFNEKVASYWLLSGTIVLAATICGLVLVPFWLWLGGIVTRRHLATYQCTLTSRSLKVARGWLVRVEKTVPLDRITDVGMVQGPIMRYLDLEALSVETAGQSADGALVRLTGIRDGRRAFRDAVLEQRDRVVGSHDAEAAAETHTASSSSAPAPGSAEGASDNMQAQLLREIRDSLLRVEQRLSESSEQMPQDRPPTKGEDGESSRPAT